MSDTRLRMSFATAADSKGRPTPRLFTRHDVLAAIDKLELSEGVKTDLRRQLVAVPDGTLPHFLANIPRYVKSIINKQIAAGAGEKADVGLPAADFLADKLVSDHEHKLSKSPTTKESNGSKATDPDFA